MPRSLSFVCLFVFYQKMYQDFQPFFTALDIFNQFHERIQLMEVGWGALGKNHTVPKPNKSMNLWKKHKGKT